MADEREPRSLDAAFDPDPELHRTLTDVIHLVASVLALASETLPKSFTDTLEKAIGLASSDHPQRIQILLRITDKSSPEFSSLQTALAKIYVRAEVMKADAKKPWVDVSVLIDGWSGCDPQGIVKGGRYPTVALGGTFDHLHAGHKILLTMAAWLATQRVIVGITDDNLLVKKKFRSELQSLTERTESVRFFLRLIGPLSLDICTPALQDVYGPTATDPDIQAILVSRETLSGADAIDEVRQTKGLGRLDRFVIDVISSDEVCLKSEELKELKMSSTEIRRWLHSQHATPTVHQTADLSN